MNDTVSAVLPTGERISRFGEPAWEVAYLFPTQGNWTEAEYLALGTNRLVELCDGRLEVLPMPTMLHQLIAKFLYDALEAFVKGRLPGIVLFASLPVRLWPGRLREPDLIYLTPQRVRNVRGQPDGADLVMEVVSPGTENRERDLEIKRREYAQAGIAEYWIVDPEERRITVLALDGQTYRVHGEFGPGAQATSVLLAGFAVAVDDVFAAGQITP
jgi:Uma2 family endonuclease